MIYLNSGANRVDVTLWENSTNLINPYFTWSLFDKKSFMSYVFYADDFSQAPYYYNSFTVSVGVGSATAGFVNITPGEFTYVVYQMASPYDLNILNAIGEVETGILVYGATSTPYNATGSVATQSQWLNMDRV